MAYKSPEYERLEDSTKITEYVAPCAAAIVIICIGIVIAIAK